MIRKEIPHWMKMCPHCLGDGDGDNPDEDCPTCKGAGIIEKGYTNPMDFAWSVLKNDDEESVESLMRRLMAGEHLTTPQLLRLQNIPTDPAFALASDEPDADDDPEIGHMMFDDEPDAERPFVRDDELPNTRTPTPMDWFDTFRMTRPDMVEHANNIQSELNRRGGFGQSPSERPDPNNRFVRHTRAEMLDGLEQMRTELERRGYNGDQFQWNQEGNDARRDMRLRDERRVSRQPEQPVRGNAQELMQMLMDGEPLTQDEIQVVKEGQDYESFM